MTVMSTKAEDVRLWQQWNRTKSDHDLQQLLNHLQPVITQAVNRWGGTLARPMLETRAKALAVEAIRSYDPTRGATLATHVTNQLQKLSRTVYTHTAAARLPEHKAVSMTTFSVGHEQLTSDLGREPTTMELADHLGWSQQRTEEFRKAHARRELLTSGEFNPSSFPIADEEDPIVGFVYHDLAPENQQLFEHITGYGGAPTLSNTELMRKFKMTQGQLSYQKRKMKDLFEDALKRKR